MLQPPWVRAAKRRRQELLWRTGLVAGLAVLPLYALYRQGFVVLFLTTIAVGALFLSVIGFDALRTRNAKTRLHKNDLIRDASFALLIGLELTSTTIFLWHAKPIFDVLISAHQTVFKSWGLPFFSVSISSLVPFIVGLVVLLIGAVAFMFRKVQRRFWGVTEVVVGICLPTFKAWGLPADPTTYGAEFWIFLLTAGVYLVVRGFDNIDQAAKAARDVAIVPIIHR